MTIINMSWWWNSWPQVPLIAISNLTATVSWNTGTIKWTDPTDATCNWVTLTTWQSSKLVRKTGAAPSTSSDGTLVLTETTRNQYSSTWYSDTWLGYGNTYYYATFSVDSNWAELKSNVANITISPFTPWANTVFYFPFESDATDHSWNWYTLSSTGTQQTVGRTFNTTVTVSKSAASWRFVSAWVKWISKWSWYTTSNDSATFDFGNVPWYMCYRLADYWGGEDEIYYAYSWPTSIGKKVWLTLWTWYHLAWGYSSTDGAICWINWVKYTISTNTNYYTWWGTDNTKFFQNKGSTKASATFSDVILETALWTNQQVTDYFNATKSKYGIS